MKRNQAARLRAKIEAYATAMVEYSYAESGPFPEDADKSEVDLTRNQLEKYIRKLTKESYNV